MLGLMTIPVTCDMSPLLNKDKQLKKTNKKNH